MNTRGRKEGDKRSMDRGKPLLLLEVLSLAEHADGADAVHRVGHVAEQWGHRAVLKPLRLARAGPQDGVEEQEDGQHGRDGHDEPVQDGRDDGHVEGDAERRAQTAVCHRRQATVDCEEITTSESGSEN